MTGIWTWLFWIAVVLAGTVVLAWGFRELLRNVAPGPGGEGDAAGAV